MFVEGLFYLNKNVASFKEHLRDFLVQIKVTAHFIALHVRKFVCIVGVHWRWCNRPLPRGERVPTKGRAAKETSTITVSARHNKPSWQTWSYARIIPYYIYLFFNQYYIIIHFYDYRWTYTTTGYCHVSAQYYIINFIVTLVFLLLDNNYDLLGWGQGQVIKM